MENKLLTFPCTFTIKIMGINDQRLIPEVVAIISSLSDTFNPDTGITTRESVKGRYLSISATIEAKSQAQLDQIYITLNKHELVKVTL